MSTPKRARSRQVDSSPWNSCALPARSVASVGMRHLERPEEVPLRERRDVVAGRALEHLLERLDRRVVVGPDAAGPRRLPQADRVPSLVRRGDQSDVVGDRAPLATGVVAQEVPHGDGLGRSPAPLGDPSRRAGANAQFASVLGDADERARERLRDREDVLGRVPVPAVEVPLARDLPVPHDEEAARLRPVRACCELPQLRAVEPDRSRAHLLPAVSLAATVDRGRKSRRDDRRDGENGDERELAHGRQATSCPRRVAPESAPS